MKHAQPRWHIFPGSGSEPPVHELRVHGKVLGAAAKTGRPGVDNYPWDWWMAPGLAVNGKAAGVTDSLREAKAQVEAAFSRRRGSVIVEGELVPAPASV